MADRPLLDPLPADLPEDWTSGQIVAPSGADVGLSKQHGYNYLMEQVNAVQRAANAINESFDTISGKRTCRVTIGTSTAGWTQADCDYLCDGTDDQEELNAAIEAVYAKGGGEIAVLGGEYFITETMFIVSPGSSISIKGEAGATVFNLSAGIHLHSGDQTGAFRISGIIFRKGNSLDDNTNVGVSSALAYTTIENCEFLDVPATESYAGDVPHSFVFKGNRVKMTDRRRLNTGGDLSHLFRSATCVLFSQNTFSFERNDDLGITVAVISIVAEDDQQVIFVDNNISCPGEQKSEIYTYGSVIIAGNSFSGLSVHVSKGGSLIGNTVIGGWINAGASSACGNTVLNGHIYASSNALVSGNYVTADTAQPAIIVSKTGPDSQEDASPSIIGNYIAGGSIGVYLRKLDWMIAPNMTNALVSGNRIWGCETPIQIDNNWSRCMVVGNMFPAGDAIVDHGTDNIIRMNSDDPGSGEGGGVAGVSSFKGRAGAVMPQIGDYTADMVGAIPSVAVSAIQAMTQEEYS